MTSLLKTRGFTPLVSIIYLNAFIDLGHKIIIQNTIFKIYDGSEQIVLTAIINALILLPFILFFAPAGRTSDRHPKTTVLQAASVAVLIITCGIGICYWQGWFHAAFALTFVLAIQSTWYGPAKYGLLKELVCNKMLSRANGIAQALATIGILSGILCFSILFEFRFTQVTSLDEEAVVMAMAPLAWALIAISCLECLLAWQLPQSEQPAEPDTDNESSTQQLKSLIRSPVLFPAVIGLSVFWSVGQMLLATYPAYAKAEIGITNTIVIQGLLATIGIGIMLGSVIGGRLSRGHIEMALIPAAGIGICLTVFLLPFVTSIVPAVCMFFAIGVVGGFLVVPLNATVQYCTPHQKLGFTIANSNLLQNIAMFSCLMLTLAAALLDASARSLLLFVAVMAVIGISTVLLKVPHTMLRLRSPVGRKLIIEGFNEVEGAGDVTFILSSWSEKNRQLLQMAYPRKIHFLEPGIQNDTAKTEVIAVKTAEQTFDGNCYSVSIEADETAYRLIYKAL